MALEIRVLVVEDDPETRMLTEALLSGRKGVCLCALAKDGLEGLELVEQTAADRFVIDIECSKGTYVRTLVEDLGAALGCPACLAALRRTRAGVFTLEGCVTLETIQAAKEAGELEKLLLGVDTVFSHLPAAQVSEKETARLLNGAPVRREDLAEGRWRLYADGAFLGLGETKDGTLRAEKLFVERA